MNFLYIDSKYNFLVVTPSSHLMLCGGSKFDEQSFKDFLYKVIHRVSDVGTIDKKGYLGDGILVRKINLAIHLNVSAWNKANFEELSKQLFEYCTNNLKLNNYHFININQL